MDAELCRLLPFVCTSRFVDHLLHFIDILNRRGQILIASLRDEDIVLDTDTADLPILIQQLSVNMSSMDRIAQIRLDDKVAEVNLSLC